MIAWCKKHGFCPINGQLEHCLAQNRHNGCKNLIGLPTEHPKGEHCEKYKRKHRHESKRWLRKGLVRNPEESGRLAGSDVISEGVLGGSITLPQRNPD